jgi:hypothetical protein
MNLWKWLTTADPSPRYTPGKIGRIAARFFLFLLLVTVVNALLALTPLGPYLTRYRWTSAVIVFLLYIPFNRILILDMPGAARQGFRRGPVPKQSAAAIRRKERNRFAGVKKGPPSGRGGRR